MAATTPPTVLLLITLISDHSPPPPPPQQQASPFPITITMLSTFTFFFFLTLFIIIYTLYTLIKNNTNEKEQQQRFIKIQSLPVNGDNSKNPHQKQENVGRTLLVEILPSNSPKWDTLFSSKGVDDEGITAGSGQEEEEKKRKKKRAKKKKPEEVVEVEGRGGGELVVGVYPFTKSSSATQRKIKQQYDQLVKSHGSKGLTLDQVGQFVNCLVEARNELQNKSEVIKRRFTITKALLLKADRSSFDRLRQQIYKLELEQKRLEEDAFVYNWLQEQLKASPAYKRMLEIGACMEMKEKDRALLESKDDDFCDISFEELLEQEKKDVFWQRNGRFKPSSG